MTSVSFAPVEQYREMSRLADKICSGSGCTADAVPGQVFCASCREKYLSNHLERFPASRGGWVYFIENTETGLIKIGFSCDPVKRLQGLKSQFGDSLVLLSAVPGSYKKERALHDFFSTTHVEGEWFSASDELCELISMASEKERERGVRQLLVAARNTGLR